MMAGPSYDRYNAPPKNLLQRFGKPLGVIALVVVLLAIAYCGVTQTDIHGRREGWSALITILFILVGLGLVTGIIRWRRRKP